MSYETNPISNRLKINKGWKNPMFPVQTLNYSRDLLLWFKVYLLLKAYLSLQQIKLLACEIRISENHTKILYLSVTKQVKKKKWSKSKWKSNSLLRSLNSPLMKAKNKKARFLLYQDLQILKKNSSLILNMWQKKILSKIWMVKPRFFSWINASQSIYNFRKKIRMYQNRSIKRKYILKNIAKNIWANKNITNKKKETLDLPDSSSNLKQTFWINKQKKKILNLLIKNKKELVFLKKSLDLIRYIQKTQNIPRIEPLIHTLHFKYNQKTFLLKKWRKIFQFWITLDAEKTQKTYDDLFSQNIDHRKTKVQLRTFWRDLKKQLLLLRKKILLFKNKPQLFSLWKSLFFNKPHRYQFLISQHSQIWKTMLQISLNSRSIFFKINNRVHPTIFIRRNFIQKQMQLNLLIRHIWKSKRLPLINMALFKNRTKRLSTQVARLIRFKYKRHYLKKKTLKLHKNHYLKRKTFQYRINSRQIYKNNLVFFTNLKLKYLIQDFVQHYFAIPLHVKLSWPLADFKNLKFYRLVFPKRGNKIFEDAKFRWTSNSRTRSIRKRYLYVGKMTKHIKFAAAFSENKNKKLLLRAISSTGLKQITGKKKFLPLMNETKKRQLSNKKKLLVAQKNQLVQLQLQSTFLFPLKKNTEIKKTKHTSQTSFYLYKKKIKQRNVHLKLKAQLIQKQCEHRLHWAAKTPFMANFIPTLTLFNKYLDPQPLADHLAKILETTKRHSSTLKLVEVALRTIHMYRGIGYRIALIGRIDGANKSRTIYLQKLNRNRSRQAFLKKVNFAMSQARATIGAFGVKVWIYY